MDTSRPNSDLNGYSDIWDPWLGRKNAHWNTSLNSTNCTIIEPNGTLNAVCLVRIWEKGQNCWEEMCPWKQTLAQWLAIMWWRISQSWELSQGTVSAGEGVGTIMEAMEGSWTLVTQSGQFGNKVVKVLRTRKLELQARPVKNFFFFFHEWVVCSPKMCHYIL